MREDRADLIVIGAGLGRIVAALAAFCLNGDCVPGQVYETPRLRQRFQRTLTDALGFQLQWPEALRVQPSPGF